MKPIDILRLEYGNSKNFMTPHILGRGTLFQNDKIIIVYELAKGRGMPRSYGSLPPIIYGISIVSYDKTSGKTERLFDDCICSEYRSDISRKLQYLRKKYAEC